MWPLCVFLLLLFARSSSALDWDTNDVLNFSCPHRHAPLDRSHYYKGRHVLVNVTDVLLWFDKSSIIVSPKLDSNDARLIVRPVSALVLVTTNATDTGKIAHRPLIFEATSWNAEAAIEKSLYKPDRLIDCGNVKLLRLHSGWVESEENFNLKSLEAPVLDCAKRYLCRRILQVDAPVESMIRPNYTDPQNTVWKYIMEDFNTHRYNLTALRSWTGDKVNNVGFESPINLIVDMVFWEIRKKIKEESNGLIKLPDVNETLTSVKFLEPFGEFDASEGEFRDLTTLKRVGDAHVYRDGLKVTASCGFGLTRAVAHYNKYRLKYGVAVNGEFTAHIDGVVMRATLVIDYNSKPCQVELKDLQILDLGKLDIDITGLGPLNGLFSDIVTWMTKYYKDQVIRRVQEKVEEVVRGYINQFDCEKLRP